MKKISVLGAGTWGMALACLLHAGGNEVVVWSAVSSEIEELAATRRHRNLPGMMIPESIRFTKEISLTAGADLFLFAVPSVFLRSTTRAAAPYIREGQLIADVAKGLEEGTFLTMTGVIADELSKAGKSGRLVALSGPTHAEEVALGIPTAIVSASRDSLAAAEVQEIFSSAVLRVYTNPDPYGVELCGALKNVVALAAGISDGLSFGDNTKAALITRGMAEIVRLGRSLGCAEQTFYGLAGIGDLVVTCTSRHSRNHNAGELIGKGYTAAGAVKEVGMVVEGMNALPAAVALAEKKHVEMPIVFAVRDIVLKGADPRETVEKLMTRDYKDEIISY